MFEDQQTQQHFHRGRMSPMHQGGAIPLAKVGSHLLVQRVIIQQAVQLPEDRIDLLRQLGHRRKHIFALIKVY